MPGLIRYFVIGIDKGKTKTYFETNDKDKLRDFVRYVMKDFNKKSDMMIIDWQDRKQVKLIDYYNTEVKR